MAYRFSNSCTIAKDEIFCVSPVNDGILTIDKRVDTVTWYSRGGLRIVRQFSLASTPLDAQFCTFKTLTGLSNNSPTIRGISILLSNGDLQIHMVTGELYEIHVPFTVAKMLAMPNGILILQDGVEKSVPIGFYWLGHPMSTLTKVELHESTARLLSITGGKALCSKEQNFCMINPTTKLLVVLSVQQIDTTKNQRFHCANKAGFSRTNSNLNYSDAQTPSNGGAMDVDGRTTNLRTPVVFSRDSPPDVFNITSGSPFNLVNSSELPPYTGGSDSDSAQASAHAMLAGSDAALRSLLSRQSSLTLQETVATPSIQRASSEGMYMSSMSASMRSQPLLYSRGTSASGGSSNNSNSAYHIRKKRASASTPSPRPSPSNFMFESTPRDIIGHNSDSPLVAGGSGVKLSSPRANTFGANEAHTASGFGAPLSVSEVFLTCLAEINLPDELVLSANIQATFVGGYDAVGGLFLNVFDTASGSYCSYSLRREDSALLDSMDEGENADTRSCSSFGEPSFQHSLELKYSYCSSSVPERGVAMDPLRGVAHVSGALEGEALALQLQSAGAVRCGLPASLQSTLLLPLTLLLTARRTVLVLIGAQVVKEVPLTWTDDLEDDEEVMARQAATATGMTTIHADGVHFVVTCEDGVRVLSLVALLGEASLHVVPLAVTAPSTAHTLAEVIKAMVPALTLMNTEGLVECVLGFVLNVRAEVGSDLALYWLLCASYGVDFKLFAQHYPSSVAHKSHYLRQIYQVFSSDAQRLYQASEDHCIATEVFFCAHSVLQDYQLRLDRDALGQHTGVQALRRVLHTTVQVVRVVVSAAAAGKAARSPLYAAHTDLLGRCGDYYSSNATAGRSIDAVVWCKEAVDALSSTSMHYLHLEFPLPPEVAHGSLLPCPTVRLAARFLKHFTEMSTAAAASNGVGAVRSPARDVLDAFVAAVHGSQDLTTTTAGQAQVDFQSVVSLFPHALRLLVEACLPLAQRDANPLWPLYLLKLVGRRDLCGHAANLETLLELKKASVSTSAADAGAKSKTGVAGSSTSQKNLTDSALASALDGLAEVEEASKLRFTEDDRVHEVCRMLRSSHHVYLKFEKAPEVSELDHRHKLQMRLLLLVRRTLACSVGRGMLTIASLEPLMAEALPIPPLSLTGRVPPANSIVQLDTTSAPEELTLWPDFHNGVAAALRVGPIGQTAAGGRGQRGGLSARSKVTRNWIMYNRTASQAKPGGDSTHAGFLLGLGLWGHLTNLSVSDTYDYLVQGYEPTTIGVLIGSAASKIGTADPLLSKTISLHMPALLPTQHGDIDISAAVQTAALVSLGLLHCGSGHRLMTEFLLAEIARSPTSDRCECRDALITAAAWALGMVLLGKGGKGGSKEPGIRKTLTPATPGPIGSNSRAPSTALPPEEDVLRGLADLRVEDRLLQFIDGGKRPAESVLFPVHSTVDISSRSSRMLEGEEINTNLTAPGATIALALIFIRSNNADILQRLALPTTIVALDAIRPDLLIYRAMATCLIQWDLVVPSAEWIKARIPSPILKAIFPEDALRSADPTAKIDINLLYQSTKKLDGKTALALYLSSVTGFCYGIGVVFAGTADEAAKKTLLDHLKLLQSFRDNKPLLKLRFALDKSLRQCVEMCVNVAALALSSVMAGSGDVDCLRVLRELRWRYEDVTYGTHMAISMAIGMIFLGGGDYSLRRDPVSAACLLLSIAPRFPQRTVDHQYHLQALRHLYVLAAEPRALHTIDVDSGTTVSVLVKVELTTGQVLHMQAPGLLPELSTIRRISVAQTKDYNSEDTSEDQASAPLSVRYFPNSIDMQQLRAGAHPSSGTEPINATSTGGSARQLDRVCVPPLFVKRVPRAAYQLAPPIPPDGPLDANSMRRLKQAATPRTFKELHEVRSPLSGDVGNSSNSNSNSSSVNLPAERLSKLLMGANADSANGESVLGQALCRNETFLEVILQASVN